MSVLETCGLRVREGTAGLNAGNDVMLLQRLLAMDLSEAVVTSNLPAQVSSMHNVILKGTFLVQVNGCSNIADSVRSIKARKEKKETTAQEKGSNNGPGYQMSPPKRVLKLNLGNGEQYFAALEHRPITFLAGVVGEKLLLSDVPVRRGVLLLNESNVVCLGGSTQKLGQEQEGNGTSQCENKKDGAAVMKPGSSNVLPKASRLSIPATCSSNSRSSSSCMAQPVQAIIDVTQSPVATRTSGAPFHSSGTSAKAQPVQMISFDTFQNGKAKDASNACSRSSSSSASSNCENSGGVLRNNFFATPTLDPGLAKKLQEKTPLITYEIPFCLLEDIKIGQCRRVKCVVQSLRGKLKNTIDEYVLCAEITDGFGTSLEARIKSDYVERRLFGGVSPPELDRVKKSDKKRYKSLMLQSGLRMQDMEGIFTVSRETAKKYWVHDVREPDEEFTNYLLNTFDL